MAEIIYVLSGEIAWFDHIRKYGENFETPYDAALELLESNPEMGPPFEVPPFRRLVIQQTTWGVFYTVEANRIVIHTILDLRQSPETIRRKLKEMLS